MIACHWHTCPTGTTRSPPQTHCSHVNKSYTPPRIYAMAKKQVMLAWCPHSNTQKLGFSLATTRTNPPMHTAFHYTLCSIERVRFVDEQKKILQQNEFFHGSREDTHLECASVPQPKWLPMNELVLFAQRGHNDWNLSANVLLHISLPSA